MLIDALGLRKYLHLDGSTQPAPYLRTFGFDAAIVSDCGRYEVLYTRLGTKGVLFKDGRVVREINRSFYFADRFEYPVAFVRLPGEPLLLAHCPNEYNELELEHAESGVRLTTRTAPSQDAFHSRLLCSPGGGFLLSAGWFWHPVDGLTVFDVQQGIQRSTPLDECTVLHIGYTGMDVQSATFLDHQHIVVSTGKDLGDGPFDEETLPYTLGLMPLSLGVFNLATRKLVSLVSVQEQAGTLHAFGRYVLSLYDHPKLIDRATGEVTLRWPELRTGTQTSSILNPEDLPPPVAVDAERQRFAVADAHQVTVICLSNAAD